jgi:hypothetical protein
MVTALPFTEEQVFAISVTERVCSCLSVAGFSIIVSTFVAGPQFRKPINRLIFFASWGNLIINLATLISESGPSAGIDSFLCQFQAFLILW